MSKRGWNQKVILLMNKTLTLLFLLCQGMGGTRRQHVAQLYILLYGQSYRESPQIGRGSLKHKGSGHNQPKGNSYSLGQTHWLTTLQCHW
jgi:hypothetical protein